MAKVSVYLNGQLIPAEQASISIFDRGFLYGDGVFESLRTYNQKPFLLEEHLKRLLRSAKYIRLKGLPSPAKLKAAVIKTLAVNKFKESYLKIIITRGLAFEHGLDPKNVAGKPNIAILIEEQKPFSQSLFITGWSAIISSISRADTPITRIKSLCYLDNLLAKLEAQKHQADEAFFLDSNGNVIEGTTSNIFIVKHGQLYTPPLESPILAGLTRNLVMKLARQSAIKVIEKALTPKEIYTADECFVTLSGAGIVPITKIWGKKIAKGKAGYLTTALIRLYNAETQKS